jgi:DNA-binding transcriptional MerR regulator
MAGLKIGELAERTGTNSPTIRYYEKIGLLPEPDRQEGNQRRYGESDVRRLGFIRRCRDFGFSLDQVRTLVSLVQDRSRTCTEARDIAQTHLAQVRARMRELRELERGIAGFVETCNIQCIGGPGPDCVILDDLSTTALSTASRRCG